MFNKPSTRCITLAIIALTFIVQGCSSTPTEPEITLEDLLAQFKIEMGANAAGGGAFGSSSAVRQSNAFESPPSESQIQVLGPNLNVFTWPIIQDTPITAWWGSDTGGTMHMGWPGSHFPKNIWPDLEVAGGVRFGNTWVIYPAGGNPNTWVAHHSEWIRRPGEQTGTAFPFDHKLEAAPPCLNCPIGQFIAGPSRHVKNDPAYQRRTVTKWFRYSDLTPWVWKEGGSTPGPTGAPELEEVHVFVLGFRVQTAAGTVINFDDEVGDIDLMQLRGQTREVADGQVPRGTFNDVTFNVDASRSFVVVGGEQRALSFATGSVVVQGPVVVGEAPITTVTLEFDVEQSLTENADGSWTMSPVVVIKVTTG